MPNSAQQSSGSAPRGSSSTASAVSIGSALTVVGAVLAFWAAANQQSERLADSVEDVRGSVSDVGRAAQSTRDAVMVLSGKVDALTGTSSRNATYFEKLDERVRALELRPTPNK